MSGKMASITIRFIDEGLKKRLRIQSALHSRSMEEEARDILRSALSTENLDTGSSFVESVRAKAMRTGGIEIEPVPRESIRNPPEI